VVSNRQRAVVVTGASSGIGEACALRLDGLGFRVFAGVRRQQDSDALRRKASERLAPVMLDVTDPLSAQSASDSVAAATGGVKLAGLVNNAGTAVAAPIEFLPLGELRRQLEVNVVGQIAVTQAFLPLLRQGSGRIVNIGSVSGRIASPLLGAYTASKFAMEGLTDTLRRELSPWGVAVSIVEPGRIATPIWEKSLKVADELLAALPRRALELYGPAIEEVRRGALETARWGAPPEKVARAVEHALTAKRPRTRYPVGPDARVGALLVRLLPDPLLDRILSAYAA
jgi:NAD(P)-dependent dehydrogenase (short-subunit alcohol dehydrogenase family)